MPYIHDKLVREHDDSEGDYYTYIALKNNGIVSEIAIKMLIEASTIEDTFPEYVSDKKHTVSLSKQQNRLFHSFRQNLRHTLYLTQYPVMGQKNRPDQGAIEVINEIKNYLMQPYGTYNLKKLVEPAKAYFGILQTKGIVPVVINISGTNPWNEWMQG